MIKPALTACLLILTSNAVFASSAAKKHFPVPPAKPSKIPCVKCMHSVQTQVLPKPITPSSTPSLAAAEQQFVDRINSERTTRHLNALTLDAHLINAARSHSEEMCKRDYFDHQSPSAGITTPMDRYLHALSIDNTASPESLMVGENIYYCSQFDSTYNVDYAHKALMDSPGHRANILEPRYTKVGVGLYKNAKGELWVTEMFLRDTP